MSQINAFLRKREEIECYSKKILHNGNAAFVSHSSLETLSTLRKYTRKHVN